MRITLRDLSDKINHVTLLDLVNALCAPVRDDVTAEQVRYASCGPDLRHTFSDEGFDQVINPIDPQTTPGLLFLLSWVPSIKSRNENLLRLRPRHRQRDAPIRANRIFAQPRAGAGHAIHNQKDLSALGRHLHAKARQAGIPVKRIFRRDRQAVGSVWLGWTRPCASFVSR